jgi:hypothetical protein
VIPHHYTVRRRKPVGPDEHGALTPSSNKTKLKTSNRRTTSVRSIETPNITIIAVVVGADSVGIAGRRTSTARSRPRKRRIASSGNQSHRSGKVGVGARRLAVVGVAEGETPTAAGTGEADERPVRGLSRVERAVGGLSHGLQLGVYGSWGGKGWPRTRSMLARGSRKLCVSLARGEPQRVILRPGRLR